MPTFRRNILPTASGLKIPENGDSYVFETLVPTRCYNSEDQHRQIWAQPLICCLTRWLSRVRTAASRLRTHYPTNSRPSKARPTVSSDWRVWEDKFGTHAYRSMNRNYKHSLSCLWISFLTLPDSAILKQAINNCHLHTVLPTWIMYRIALIM
jgi:hypothetical protein